MKNAILSIGLAGALSACATTSFAPPGVNTQRRVAMNNPNGCSSLTADAERNIDSNVAGARDLIDNFELAYRCAQDELANGRQFFEIPMILLGVAGLIGPRLGLSPDGVLLAGTGAGLSNAANGYYVPKIKAGFVASAHRAVVCVKSASVGLESLKNKPDPAQLRDITQDYTRELAQRVANIAGVQQFGPNAAVASEQHVVSILNVLTSMNNQIAMGSIKVDAEEQYFQLISSGLLTIHSILGERLRGAGSADATTLLNDLKKLAKEHEDALKKLNDAKGAKATALTAQNFAAAAEADKEIVELKIEAIKPLVQTCVLQARL